MSTTTARGQPGWRAALLVGCAAGLLAAAACALFPSLELASLDARFRLRGSVPGSSRILLVTIDDESLASLSHWSSYGRVIRGLKQRGARLVVSDIIFRFAGEDAADLIQATREGGRVVQPVAFSLFDPGDWPADGAITVDGDPVPEEVLARAYPGALEQGSGPLSVDEVLAPHPPVTQAAAGLGQIGVVVDPDGVFRRFPLLVSLDGRPFPSVPLEVARLVHEAGPGDVSWTGRGVELRAAGRDPLHFPTAPAGRVLLDFGGGWSDPVFQFVRAEQILGPQDGSGEDRALADKVQGKICLMGVTGGTGNTDLAPTPFELNTPRMLGLATLVDQLLTGRFLTEPGWWLSWLLCLLLAAGIALQASRPSAPRAGGARLPCGLSPGLIAHSTRTGPRRTAPSTCWARPRPAPWP